MGKINIKSLITTHEDLKEEKESQSHRLLYNFVSTMIPVH